MINLLDNAVTVLSGGGTISTEIRLDKQEQVVRLTVKDNGPGMTEQVKLRLFEPYFSTRKSGTGLGLAIANTIITEHNGTVRVRDNSPVGTVFTVELPFDN